MAAAASGGHRADAGDREGDPGGRFRLPAAAIHHDRGRRHRPLPADRLLERPRLGDRHRLPDRRGAFRLRRLHRNERRSPGQRPHRGGGQARRRPGAPRGVLGGLGDRPARRRPGPARRRRLLRDSHRVVRRDCARGHGASDRARVRRLVDLRIRPSRRRDLHEGSRRRRRSRRQGRGGHPGGRSAQPGRNRGQRRRQRRRLRRDGSRPVRDLCGHARCRDVPRRSAVPGDGNRRVPARDRRCGDPGLGGRDVLRARRTARLDHGGALQGCRRGHRALRPPVHSGHGRIRQRSLPVLEPLRLHPDRPRRHLPARCDHRVLHGDALGSGEGHLARLADRACDEHHRRPRDRDAGDGPRRCS